uniref:Uncharacterized protein n=1 Tax=Lactuca sativa TaxID=4236 RepID=A0A9R1W067_LACSA|nr:hypothetical protein LSAT_V11C400222610 [Lactuca sativa]
MSDKQDPTFVKALHPVYTVTNIQNKIRTLDGTKVSYSSCVRLFRLHAKGYRVLAHIDGSDPPSKTDPTYENWSEIDAIVLQWIYGKISDDLLAQVLEPDSTAYEAWFKIQNIFLNNKGSSADALEHEFTNLTLRAMSSLAPCSRVLLKERNGRIRREKKTREQGVEAYCQRLKDLASQLNDVDCLVNEKQIVAAVEHNPPTNSNFRRTESGNSRPNQQRNTNRRALVSASSSRPSYTSSGWGCKRGRKLARIAKPIPVLDFHCPYHPRPRPPNARRIRIKISPSDTGNPMDTRLVYKAQLLL